MTDPLVGVLAKAAGTAADEASKLSGSLLLKALGPTADVVGEYWRERMQAFLDNRRRILMKTAEKSERLGLAGPANLRVADKVFVEGSSVDDELAAEYFSGLLAASRTPDGRDDRAISWTSTVARLSSPQIRLHYLLYREWAERLRGSRLNVGNSAKQVQATAELPMFELALAVSPGASLTDPVETLGDGVLAVLEHAVTGLRREGLLGDAFGFGHRSLVGRPLSRFEQLVWVGPSISGVELFGWSLGYRGINAVQFIGLPRIPDLDPPIPRLANFDLPQLHPRSAEGGSGSAG